MLFRPAEGSKEIVDAYRRYLLTTFRTNKDYYNEQLREISLGILQGVPVHKYAIETLDYVKMKSKFKTIK